MNNNLIGGNSWVDWSVCPYFKMHTCRYIGNCYDNGRTFDRCLIHNTIKSAKDNKKAPTEEKESDKVLIDISSLSMEEAVEKIKNIYCSKSFKDSQIETWNKTIKDNYSNDDVISNIMDATCKYLLQKCVEENIPTHEIKKIINIMVSSDIID